MPFQMGDQNQQWERDMQQGYIRCRQNRNRVLDIYSQSRYAPLVVLVICCNSCFRFWATVCKTVRPMLSDRCLPVCPVCNVGVLWPNGWTDQDETWRAGRPQPRPHCVTRGPSSLSPKGHIPRFSAHVCCSQTAGLDRLRYHFVLL